jgi:hypothetical protein
MTASNRIELQKLKEFLRSTEAMLSTRIERPTPSLESRILRAITASDELAAIAVEAENAEALHFTEAQFELLVDQLVALDEAARAMTGALRRKWHKAHARAESLHRILSREV